MTGRRALVTAFAKAALSAPKVEHFRSVERESPATAISVRKERQRGGYLHLIVVLHVVADEVHVGGVLLLLHLLVLLLLLLRLVHTLMMVSLRGVQAGGAQQGSALPEQRCHLHLGCVVCVARRCVSRGSSPAVGRRRRDVARRFPEFRSRRRTSEVRPRSRSRTSRDGSNPLRNTGTRSSEKTKALCERYRALRVTRLGIDTGLREDDC